MARAQRASPSAAGTWVEGEGDGDEVAAPDDDEGLAVGAESGLAPAGAERLEGLREVARERLLEGDHPGAAAPAGVADADDLVVGHAAEGALVGLERAGGGAARRTSAGEHVEAGDPLEVLPVPGQERRARAGEAFRPRIRTSTASSVFGASGAAFVVARRSRAVR